MNRTTRLMIWAAVFVAVFGSLSALACSVPVFRYALERWMVDPYQVVVFHDGTLTEAQEQVVEQAKARAVSEMGMPVFTFESVDVSGEIPEGFSSVWDGMESQETPRLALLFPPGYPPENPTVWPSPSRRYSILPPVRRRRGV